MKGALPLLGLPLEEGWVWKEEQHMKSSPDHSWYQCASCLEIKAPEPPEISLSLRTCPHRAGRQHGALTPKGDLFLQSEGGHTALSCPERNSGELKAQSPCVS